MPAPIGPTRMTEPRTETSGNQRSTSSSGPPAKTFSVPDATSVRLPSTGESSNPAPVGSSTVCSREVAAGETVDIWITVVASEAPAATPSGPSITSCSATGSVTMMITASARRAASAGLSAAMAPSSTSGCAFSIVRFQTTSSWPESRSRRAIRLPMPPSPMTATVLMPNQGKPWENRPP